MTTPEERPAGPVQDPGRWQQLQQCFHEALALGDVGRQAYVQAIADVALQEELQRLLAAEPRAEQAIQGAIGQAAAQLVLAGRVGYEGLRLGPWRLLAHHADGGMGAVYRAQRDDGQYEQQVAVKLLNPAGVGPAARARLEGERRILARLQHPHIARLLDGGATEDGQPYLVMEFVEGEPIDTWCDTHAADTAARLRLFVQVCRAVDHAHRNLVVHRDLKPSNILVDGEGRPRLLDFGIAKLLDQAPGVTRTGERVLTPSHASPEQLTGGVVTTATDVYALGVLLYDLLAGRLPHGAADTPPATLARQIVEQEPPRPSAAVTSPEGPSSRRLAQARSRGAGLTPARLARELQGDLDNIVLMALRKEPERRYASAAALADDVERYLAHRPVQARPDTLAYRTAKLLRRHRVAVPATALALLLALGAAATFTWHLADERDRALAAEARARRAADFTASVLENTGAHRSAEREVSVQALLREAAQRVDQELAAEPELATRMRLAIGDALYSWGAHDEAHPLLMAALQESRTRGAAGERDQAEILSLLGSLTHDQGDLERSLDWTRQAEALWQRVGSPAERGKALGDLALAYNGLRRRSDAEPLFRAALAQLRQAHAGDHDDIAWMLNNLAWGLHAMGRLDEAAPLYEEALAMQRRLGTARVDLAQTQNNYAGLLYDRGDLKGAGLLWEEVLAQNRQVYGEGGHAAVARSQALVALVALARGEDERAVQLRGQALEGIRASVGERHRYTATAMSGYGAALLQAGRLDEAGLWLRRALVLSGELLPAGHGSLSSIHLSLAQLGLARGGAAGWREAEVQARAALSIVEGLASPDRVPRDEIEWVLAQAEALQGRRPQGLERAQALLQRVQASLPAGHWRRLAYEAGAGLPPFVRAPAEAVRDQAWRTREQLAGQLGPQAPVVRALDGALAAAE